MDELTVIGVENGALVVVGAEGTRFRVPITEGLHTALRQNRPAAAAPHRVGPREVQAMIRRGLTAAEVSEQSGEALEYIQRFEGPVLAEREYVVTVARSVPVAVVAETESGGSSTFGSVIDQRLGELHAEDIRWHSHKTDAHWIVSVSFVDDEVERTAVWSFEPKRSTLAPANHEAQSLSQQGETPAPLLPRLRAVPAEPPVAGRFDSGAFDPAIELPRAGLAFERPERPLARNDSDLHPAREMGHTADLLEALRRRRGEREAAPTEEWESSRAAHPSTGSIRIVDIALDMTVGSTDDSASATVTDSTDDNSPLEESSASSQGVEAPGKQPNRRGRASMPSWDDIVFGARPDDNPA